MANRIQIQNALQKPYDRILLGKEVLSPVFGSCFSLSSSIVPAAVQPNKSEQTVVGSVSIYGNINLEDGTEITCYEIILQPTVRIEQSRVAIQRYVRKLLTAGQIALVNFISPQNKNVWRLTLVAKDSEITEDGIKEKTTHPKRYTYLLGPSETCKTAAERFESLSIERKTTFQALVNAFSVEKLSDAFFDEYTLHYQKFCNYLQESNFRKSVFKISFPVNATKEEKDKACKPIRDFVKKLLGRIVFLYFVQKKRWLGAGDTNYKDGLTDFIKQLFKQSGGNDAFYSTWLTVLFFETLNKDRTNDDFKMPDGRKVKVPFLNGGLFDKEDHDEHILTFKSKLFHNSDFEDTILTEKNPDYSRGFLDFLNSFNFTVHEDSLDDHIVAVDPEMLGHIFENLLEDNKDKGAFYTPKEIVHYMCHESLTEYLSTHLSKEYTVYKEIGNAQVELFGNETKQGQLKIVEQMGDKALNRDDVAYIVKYKDISKLTKSQLERIDQLLDTVKICDPAIGSGAFPMGLLQEIFSIKEVIAFELGLTWKPADIKESIIKNSIYGVDIEKGAVDIARLRFWLSLVVDEEKPRALPNLDYKIVAGDSLVSKFEGEIIEIDWERKSGVGKAKEYIENIHRLLKEIADKQKNFFKPTNKNKKKEQADIRGLKLELLINQLSFNKEKFIGSNVERGGFAPTASDLRFNEDLKRKIKEFDKHILKLQILKKNKDESFEHFDWKLDFPEILNPYLVNDYSGYDIIIANPPYLKERDNAHIFKDVNNSRLGKLWHQGKMDYWFYFLHMAMELSKNGGIISFITSRYWLNSQGASKLIDRIEDDLSFINVVDIGKLKVFDNVAGHHMIHVYKKGKSDSFVYKKLLNDIKYIQSETENEEIKFFILYNSNVFKNSNIILSTNRVDSVEDFLSFDDLYDSSIGVQESVDKISAKQLKEIPNNKLSVGKGIFVLSQDEVTSLNLSSEELNVLKPYLDPNDVKRYKIAQENKKYLIYSDKDVRELIAKDHNYKNLKKHLDSVKDYITSSNKPYGIHRPRQAKYFEQPKIIFKGMFVEPEFTYDEYGFYFGFSFSSIIKKSKDYSLKYLLAILNSKYAKHWFYENGKIRGAGVDIGVEKLRRIPIVKTTNQQLIEILVDYVLFLKSDTINNLANEGISLYFQRVIDAAIYELYFPKSIKSAGAEVLKYLSDLPILIDEKDDISKGQDLKAIQQVYKQLTNPAHPLDSALLKLHNIDEVKIIEAKQ